MVSAHCGFGCIGTVMWFRKPDPKTWYEPTYENGTPDAVVLERQGGSERRGMCEKLFFLSHFNYLFLAVYLFVWFWLRCAFVAGYKLSSSCDEPGFIVVGSLLIAVVPHRSGFCCCRAQTLGHTRFSSCDSQALQHRLNNRGLRAELLQGMWDFSSPGMEPVSCVARQILYHWATREALKTGFVSMGLVGWFVFGLKTWIWIKFLGCVDAVDTRTGFENYGLRRICESYLSTLMGLFSELMIGWVLLLLFLGSVKSDSET